MIKKILLIVLVLIVFLAVFLPLILKMVGRSGFPFSIGSSSGTGGNILLSGDFGETWTSSNISEEDKIPFPSQIYGLTFHPQNSDIIYLASKGSSFWKSSNGGKSWKKMADKTGTLKPAADIYKVASSPANPKIIYLAAYQDSRGKVLRSEDNGDSFKEIYQVTSNGYGVFDIFVSPGNSNDVTIITGQGGFLQSLNGGQTWRVKKWFSDSLTKLIVNPSFPSEMYLLTSGQNLYKTFDGGDTWTDITSGAGGSSRSLTGDNPFSSGSKSNSLNGIINSLTVVPQGALYMSAAKNIIKSTDGGYSWSSIDVLLPPNGTSISAVAVSPQNSNIILAGVGNQIYKSIDAGLDWKVISLPSSKTTNALLYNPLKSGTVFAITQ